MHTCIDISVDIHVKSVDYGYAYGCEIHIHGNPVICTLWEVLIAYKNFPHKCANNRVAMDMNFTSIWWLISATLCG